MRIEIDQSKCEGYAACLIEAPELFDMDEARNQAFVRSQPDDASARLAAEAAARMCPTTAITLVEE